MQWFRHKERIFFVAAFVAWMAIDVDTAAAQPASRPAVGLVRVSLPLAGNADRLYQARLQREIERLVSASDGERRPRLILEFTTADSKTATEFERALSLARFLIGPRAAQVKTLAFAPEGLEGHAVLVALACEEIALGPDAEIGLAGSSESDAAPLEPSIRAAYQQIAEARRTAPPEIAVAMVDRSVELVRVETDRGVLFTTNDADDLAEDRELIDRESLSPAGSMASFTGRLGRELGFVKYLAADRGSLARALGVSPEVVVEDQSLNEPWRPVMIDLDGPLNGRLGRRLETLIGNELEQNNVNWIGLRIDSTSGDWQTALRLAQTVAELNGGEVRTVAYVPRRAEGPAALVALSCGHLVLQEGATISGAADDAGAAGEIEIIAMRDEEDRAEEDRAENDPEGDGRRVGGGVEQDDAEAIDAAAAEQASEEIAPVVATIRETLAPATDRTWSLLAATADPAIEIASYSNRTTGEVRAMSGEEVAQLEDSNDWRRGDLVVAGGERLELDADRAEELGVTWQTVDQFDGLVSLYGFDAPPRTARPNWALELVEALASPGFAAMLLVIGVVGVYVELSSPGLGIGGFVAAVAFLLFFWSKFLDGTADWLEVLLFVTGVVFILVEILVLPGVGVFGLGGGLLVVAGLVLASQTFVLPKTDAQLVELRNSLGAVAGAGVMCIVAGMVLRHYLPQSPIFRRAMLMPPDEADRIEQDRREAMVDYEHLVGKQGSATTDLLPAGKAEIDGEPVDVIADGDVIDRGEKITVVKTQGSRVLVRRV